MHTSLKLIALPLAVLLTACSPSQPDVEVTQQEFGSEWPFTITEGRLKCINSAVVLITDENEYALNGVAQQEGYSAIESIWKEDPNFYQMAKQLSKSEGKSVEEVIKLMGTPTKVNIGPILDKGLALCK